MGILKKLTTALRGGIREIGEVIIDSNSIRILEQELDDSKNSLSKAKSDLAGVVAERMKVERKLSELKKLISEHENYVTQALSKGNEGLALEVAEKISSMEEEYNSLEQAKINYDSNIKNLEKLIRTSQKSYETVKRQVSIVKATGSVQKATRSINESYNDSGTSILSAKSSLERIQQKQKDLDDKLKAQELVNKEMSGDNLEDKLKDAGIVNSNSAQSVLDRIKNKHKQ